MRILKGIREAVGPNFVVGARINGNDFVEGGNDQDACVEIAKYLEPYVDYFNVSCGVYASAATMIEPCYSPEGWRRPFVEAIKHAVKVPCLLYTSIFPYASSGVWLRWGGIAFISRSPTYFSLLHIIKAIF